MKNYSFRRYTDVPSLLHILQTKTLTLLDPTSWDDKNDATFLQIYKRRNKLKSVLALCFTQANETYHHWKVFAPGAAGVCLAFRKEDLLQAISDFSEEHGSLIHKPVQYLKMDEIHGEQLRLADLPFIKRYPYRDEDEYRFVYSSASEDLKAVSIPFPLAAIDRISLSPWLPKALKETLITSIKLAAENVPLDVFQTTIKENARWKKAGELAI